MKPTTRILVSLLLMIGLAALTAGNALAAIAANTRIVNTATLSYDDGTGIKTSSSEVSVTVSLKAAKPDVFDSGGDQTTAYAGPNTTLTNTFTVRANANGPDSYSLTVNLTEETNTAGATPTTIPASPITLGATVTLTGSTATVLVVPADGSANFSVNGIEDGDFVYISGATYEVDSIVDNETGTSTITLATALAGGAPGDGVLIAEEVEVAVEIEAGNISAAGANVVVKKTLTVASETVPGETTTSDEVMDTFTSGAATLIKYVRNTDVASGDNTGLTYEYNAITYYQEGVEGESGHVLEYLLVASNTTVAPVTSAKIEDELPTDFVTLKADAYGTDEVTYVDENDNVTTLAEADTYAGGTLTVYVGGADPVSAPGGTIPGNSEVLVLYQVTINP